nr:rex polyprotein [Bovine leukemia virus]
MPKERRSRRRPQPIIRWQVLLVGGPTLYMPARPWFCPMMSPSMPGAPSAGPMSDSNSKGSTPRSPARPTVSTGPLMDDLAASMERCSLDCMSPRPAPKGPDDSGSTAPFRPFALSPARFHFPPSSGPPSSPTNANCPRPLATVAPLSGTAFFPGTT